MESRPLGSTGLDVSVLGFGAMRIPGKPPEEVSPILRRAIELGVNYIDTAPGYGDSEVLIGHGLQGLDVSRLVISTKSSPDSDPTADAVRRRVEESLKRMGIPQISVLQFWGLNTPEVSAKVLAGGGPLEGARRLQEEGLVRHVGFTTHGMPKDVIALMETGEFASVTGRYHYLDVVYDPIATRARELGMAFVAMTPLGQGWLAKPSPALQAAVGKERGPVEFALRYIAARPEVSTIIVGVGSLAELEEAYAALGGTLGEGAELRAVGQQVRERIAQLVPPATYCTGCRACLPCPEGVNIPELLRLNNLLRAYDLFEWCADRYKLMGNAAHWYPGVKADKCTECGDCEPRCPEALPVIRLLKALHDDLYSGERGRRSH
jgi:uncharacterized protein